MKETIIESENWMVERIHISFDDIKYVKLTHKDDKEYIIVSELEWEELMSMHAITL